MSEQQVPFITVVVPVRNEVRHIGRTLGQLLAQDYPADKFEVVVVDGMSTDDTAELVRRVAREHPQVRIFSNERRLSSAGRNVGFREGGGEVFLVVDGHCHLPDRSLLMNTARLLAETGADCLGRPQPLDPPDLSEFQRSVAAARGSWLGHGSDSLIYAEYEGFASPVSNGATYRRSVFEKVGHFDEQFDACEDVEFNYRVAQAGLRSYMSPALTVKYYPRESLAGLFRQMTRYGRGRRRLHRKHPEALTVNQLAPAALVGGAFALVLALAGAALGPWWVKAAAFFVFLAYALYFALVILESVRLALRTGWGSLRFIPGIFLAIHVGLGFGYLLETAGGSASPRWGRTAP